MLLKFNNIRDLSDARYASAAMAEWIGFSVGYPDSLPVGQIQEIVSWCAGPKLILELAPDFNLGFLSDYLSMLPVDGLEFGPELQKDIKVLNLVQNLEFIYKGNATQGGEGFISHSDAMVSKDGHIANVLPGTISPDALLKADPWAISLDCHPADNSALKNYDNWTSFLESIGVF